MNLPLVNIKPAIKSEPKAPEITKPVTTTPRTWAPIPKVVPLPPPPPPTTPPPTTTTVISEPGIPIKEKSKQAMKVSKSNNTKRATTDKLKKPKPVNSEEEKPALPASASWAKAQPAAPKEVITPTHFGPSLSDALQTLQKPKSSPSMKAKKEKKGKGRMVRLEEFEEAKKPQPPKAHEEETKKEVNEESHEEIQNVIIHEKKNTLIQEQASIQDEPEMESSDVNELALDDHHEEKKMEGSGLIMDTEPLDEKDLAAIQEPVLEELKVTAELTSPDLNDMVFDEQVDDECKDHRDYESKMMETADECDALELTEESIQNDLSSEGTTTEDEERVEGLASLNQDVIKAFDSNLTDGLSTTTAADIPKDVEHPKEDPLPLSPGLSERISSPLVAMERLSTLVEHEISSDQPVNHFPPPPPQPQQEMLDNNLPFAEHRRQPMPPPGLAGPPPPPILPEWMNRGFDPFNGQDPSLIAMRRLQHSQRMMEASGMFGINNGFPQHRPPPPPPPPPSVSPFGFHPNFNESFSHQSPPPPFANMIARPPPHPMMRPHPQDRVNMPPFGVPHPIDDARLRAEFNAINLNREDFQSRENLRALLPNVNISFNQQKGVMDQMMQQKEAMDQMMQQKEAVDQMMQQRRMEGRNKIPFYRQESSFMDDRLPQNQDVRTEAQNFFGEFLRKAQDTPGKKEEEYAKTGKILKKKEYMLLKIMLRKSLAISRSCYHVCTCNRK
ncbi:unnamed protein product [Rhizopus stolonifer]